MQRYGQKTSKMPQKWGFSPICDPQDFFKNLALSLLYPYGFLTSYKKLEKTNGRQTKDGPRTDHWQTTDRPQMDHGWTARGDYIGPPSDKHGYKIMCKMLKLVVRQIDKSLRALQIYQSSSFYYHHINSLQAVFLDKTATLMYLTKQ